MGEGVVANDDIADEAVAFRSLRGTGLMHLHAETSGATDLAVFNPHVVVIGAHRAGTFRHHINPMAVGAGLREDVVDGQVAEVCDSCGLGPAQPTQQAGRASVRWSTQRRSGLCAGARTDRPEAPTLRGSWCTGTATSWSSHAVHSHRPTVLGCTWRSAVSVRVMCVIEQTATRRRPRSDALVAVETGWIGVPSCRESPSC